MNIKKEFSRYIKENYKEQLNRNEFDLRGIKIKTYKFKKNSLVQLNYYVHNISNFMVKNEVTMKDVLDKICNKEVINRIIEKNYPDYSIFMAKEHFFHNFKVVINKYNQINNTNINIDRVVLEVKKDSLRADSSNVIIKYYGMTLFKDTVNQGYFFKDISEIRKYLAKRSDEILTRLDNLNSILK